MLSMISNRMSINCTWNKHVQKKQKHGCTSLFDTNVTSYILIIAVVLIVATELYYCNVSCRKTLKDAVLMSQSVCSNSWQPTVLETLIIQMWYERSEGGSWQEAKLTAFSAEGQRSSVTPGVMSSSFYLNQSGFTFEFLLIPGRTHTQVHSLARATAGSYGNMSVSFKNKNKPRRPCISSGLSPWRTVEDKDRNPSTLGSPCAPLTFAWCNSKHSW